MRRALVGLVVIASLFAAGLGTSAALAEGHQGPRLVVLADGLNNPRDLVHLPGGYLLVAEAGRGGSELCFDGGEGPEGGELCVGSTGSIVEVAPAGGLYRRIISNLPSVAGPDGVEATGPVDVDVNADGRLVIAMGLGATAEQRDMVAAGVPAARRMGTVLTRPSPWSGTIRTLADLAEFEDTDPDGMGVDSNPNGIITEGRGAVAVDSGGNTLVRVQPDGRVQTIAVLPSQIQANPFGPGEIPAQAVPTNVERGPDGAFFVGELTGFPFAPGSARVYRVGVDGSVSVYASGFTNIMDIGFGPDGSLYVLEISSGGGLLAEAPGALWRLAPGGGSIGDAELLVDGLFFPGGLEVSQGGRVFLTVNSILPGAGQVVEVVGL